MRRRIAVSLGLALLVGGTVAAPAIVPASAAPRRPAAAAPSNAQVLVQFRGNGHGIGMSQYGAQGAALKGLTARQILNFYYPQTQLVTERPSVIRVRLTSLAKRPLTVLAKGKDLSVTGYGKLPVAKFQRFRLIPSPSGRGLALQGRLLGQPWTTLRAGLPGSEHFFSASGWVQVVDWGGQSSTRYLGWVRAVRNGAGELIVNRLGLNSYVAGVVPREVPASWRPAAVRAQAIAARTYAADVRAAAAPGSQYDICDNTDCQVYGGLARYTIRGLLIWSDDPAALTGNRNKLLYYRGAPILAMYSASNGGSTVAGGEPYLLAKADPYDTPASGDPYLDQTTSAPLARVAKAYGLAAVTAIRVTKRVGVGPWGGRIVSATIVGKSRQVSTDGDQFGAALGVFTAYLRVQQPVR